MSPTTDEREEWLEWVNIMLTHDNRAPGEVEELMDFAVGGEPRPCSIRINSPKDLREHYGELLTELRCTQVADLIESSDLPEERRGRLLYWWAVVSLLFLDPDSVRRRLGDPHGT